MLAIEEADLIIFMVDVTYGIHELDSAVALLLRRTGKKVLVVVNKVDNYERLPMLQSFTGWALAIITLLAR